MYRANEKSLYKEFMVFLMASILKAAVPMKLPSETLYCMIAKISGRLQKLDRNSKCRWLKAVEEILQGAVSCIEASWQAAMKMSDPDLQMSPIPETWLTQDKYSLYSELDGFIKSFELRQSSVAGVAFQPTWSVPKWETNTLPLAVASLSQGGGKASIDLLAFENWVSTSLDAWIRSNIRATDTSSKLLTAMSAYHGAAHSHYYGDPEGISLMVLTMLELWVACDRSACEHHQLLKEYDHGIPFEILQSLALPFKSHMERLHRVETYVAARQQHAAEKGNPCVFSSFGESNSFAVRFFANSDYHQSLKQKIEHKAEDEREMKRVEFQQKQQQYLSHMDKYRTLNHEYDTRVDQKTGIQHIDHRRSCQSCYHWSQAENLAIEVHEWPLPREVHDAQHTVFELQVPSLFSSWRDATACIILDVLQSVNGPSTARKTEDFLSTYLSAYYEEPSSSCRFGLVSTTKSNHRTHRNLKSLETASETSVLLNNGLTLRYYDKVIGGWVSEFEQTDQLAATCTYQLSKSCASLQKFMFRPFHCPNGLTANHVISEQSQCSVHLSLEEFKAMASMPCGYRIQWLNILVQLYMPTVDFTKRDTIQLILQISRQVGPPGTNAIYRAGHQVLRNEAFVFTCLEGLEASLKNIKDNWETYHALNGFIILSARLLSLCPTSKASMRCLAFLADCRTVALTWLGLLQNKVKQSENDDTRMEFLQYTLNVSQICIASFDVDENYLSCILRSPSDAATLIESSITAHDSSCGIPDSDNNIDEDRVRRVLYKSLGFLQSEIVQKKAPCLDMALRKSWAAYPGGATWKAASLAHDHWLVTSTTSVEPRVPLMVHYNLLTGELLVNGFPLSRLPAEYEKHPTYATFFGKTALEVLPTDMPGMVFSTKKAYHGYTLYFNLSSCKENDLLFVATTGADTYDVIPSRLFDQVLPHEFVNNYVHWYNRKSQIIEFREKANPWKSSPAVNWTMSRGENGWALERQAKHILLGLQTETVNYVASLFAALECKEYLHITLLNKSDYLTIELPRLQLDFHLEAGSIRFLSRQYGGMYVDTRQRIGTLVGLESKLVLRNEANQRKVLIPDGAPKWYWSRLSNHVRVHVQHGTSKRTHCYDIDILLHRLVDNGSLQSKLVICHLHALTSYCLPDDLTGTTGTEAAISILCSASLWSFECFNVEDLQKLSKIADLSPAREYYPDGLKCMETVHWDSNLSFLSQDNTFFALVHRILTRVHATKFFYPGMYDMLPEIKHVNAKLGKRQSMRAASFQVCGFGAENRSVNSDVIYQSRDRRPYSERSTRTFKIAHMLIRDQESLVEPLDHGLVDRIWGCLNGDTRGRTGQMSAQEISYDSQWLEDQDVLLRKYWCPFHLFLASPSSELNRFQIMLCLSTMAYAKTAQFQTLQAIATFAKIPALGQVRIPDSDCFQISEGRSAVRSYIYDVAKQKVHAFYQCPEAQLCRRYDETEADLISRRYREFSSNMHDALDSFVSSICCQWICDVPELLNTNEVYMNTVEAMRIIRQKWILWYHNHLFYEYLCDIVTSMRSYGVVNASPPDRKTASELHWQQRDAKAFIDCHSLFAATIPLPSRIEGPELDLLTPTTAPIPMGSRLMPLLGRLKTIASPKHPHQRTYIGELEKSLEYLETRMKSQGLSVEEHALREILCENEHHCQANVDKIYLEIHGTIISNLKASFLKGESASADSWQVSATFMSPRMSSAILLGNLARPQWQRLSPEWKKAIVMYGVAITKLQRAKRMTQIKTRSDLLKELSNLGHTNWNPADSPETLLLEIESGIVIRQVQEHVASEMRSPRNERNAVMQLNMGEGKSSVIVPIVAAHLADGSKLVRVIVGKPQAKELFRTLMSKLGGLLNRRIYHMPFNRSLRLTSGQAKTLHGLYKECIKEGGVLLLQPEHILSFKLMAIEYQSFADKEAVGTALIDLQHFFDSQSRDIVDESDENFSPKFELIYTMGVQRPMELSPERWTILQRVLEEVACIAPSVQQQYPESIEIIHRSRGHFPRIRILRSDAGTLLLRKIAQKFCDTGLPGLPIGRQSKDMREAVFDYIFEDKLSADQIALVEKNAGFFTESVQGPLLILRGLIAGRVLQFALGQKRWRVNYGLDERRRPSTKLAVPYRAKDSPSPRAEFSHPDVVILLTCLSYYYEGLNNDALSIAFTHLLKSDQAGTEYHEWVKDAPYLPPSFHRLTGVNIKDTEQVTGQIFPHLKYSKSAIDYFLSRMVFPKEMKEFSHKLSASGWDLGLQKRHATTGFSGTNDSRHVLPLDVKQLDIPEQMHTNALVLENLLRPENEVQLLRPLSRDGASDVETLFGYVATAKNQVHVIVDVGAQILEHTNIEAAIKWLKMLPREQKQDAVVYFNDDDVLCVIDRKGVVEKLQTSPYSEQLDRCLVFLDQAHTRGTDLKLPEYYRAAVTLGPELTKDRLVQACMRMRKLAQGQSVVFCISGEIETRIHIATGKTTSNEIGVVDVLIWAISETHDDLQRIVPLWAIQGARFERQKKIWNRARMSTGLSMSRDQAEEFLEEEAQTIEDRYRPRSQSEDISSPFGDLTIDDNDKLAAIQERCDAFGVSQFKSAALQEEQEKELAPEIEQERQVERPRAVEPEVHQIHPHLARFIETGVIPADSPAFKGAFVALENTSVADTSDVRQFPNDLLVTADYAQTVKLRGAHYGACADSYQRPIQWILTGRAHFSATIRAIILSPHESQELMPQIMRSKCTNLHLYAPRASLAFAPLDPLRLYTVPALGPDWELPNDLRLQLNLFAGQLYFASLADYRNTCDMLSLAWRPPSDGVVVETDGFITSGGRSEGGRAANFVKSPVMSVKKLLTVLRRDCQEIDKTHWGQVIGGEHLTEVDFAEP